MTKPSTKTAEEAALVSFNGVSAIEKINQFLSMAPTVQDDPTEAMLSYILASPDPTTWNQLFKSSSLRDNKGLAVRINAYRVQPSDFEGGLTHYMVLDVTTLEDGVKGVITCSSQMAIAQILNAEARGFWPLDVRIVEKDKPTKAGFRPIHLEYLGKADAPLGDPSKVVAEQ